MAASCVTYLNKNYTSKQTEYYTNVHFNIEKELVSEKIISDTGKILDSEKLKIKDDEYIKKYNSRVFKELGKDLIQIDVSNIEFTDLSEEQIDKITKYDIPKEIKIKELSEITKDIEKRLFNALKALEKTTKINKIDIKNEVENLLKNLQNTKDALKIHEYINEALKFSTITKNKLTILEEGNKRINIPTSLLERIDDKILIFDLLDSIKDIINDKETKIKLEELDIDHDDIVKTLDKAISEINDVKKLRIDLGKKHIANKLSNYSNKAMIIYRYEAELKYKKINNKQIGESIKQYNQRIKELVDQEVKKNYSLIKEQEYNLLYNKLNYSPFDINGLAGWVSSEKDLNSDIIQLASKLLDESDLLKDKDIMDYKIKAYEIYENFEKEASGVTAQEKYKGLYEETSNGTLHISTKYKNEWNIQNKKSKEKFIKAVEKYDENTKEYQDAVKERKKWISENTKPTTSGLLEPNDKWLNQDYKKIMSNEGSKKEMLKFLIESSFENDKDLDGNLSLITKTDNPDLFFIKAPSIGKSTFEKIDKNLINNVKDGLKDIYTIKADETQYGQLKPDDPSTGSLKTLTKIDGEVISGVPIHFRNKMNIKNISYDLLSSVTIDTYMSKNYKYKSKITPELELLKDIVSEKKVGQTYGFMKRYLNSSLSEEDQKVKEKEGLESNEYKVLSSIIENRLYGKETIATEYAPLANSLMGWSANSMLMFNIPSGIVNTLQGKVFNFIEAIGGNNFNTKNLKNADELYFNDIGNNMKDIGKPIQTSITNQLIDLFDIQGSMKALSNKFIEDKRVKALFKNSTAYGISHMGEHYVQATLMYAILDKIKVLDKNGNFINKDGKIVDEKNSMSLANAFSKDEKNNLILNKHAIKTTFGNQTLSLTNLTDNKALLEVKGFINKVAHDLHGNYNSKIQSQSQRYVVGKMLFMLRKWLVPGFNSRWRGTATTLKNIKKYDTLDKREEKDLFYSEDLQSIQEGYYSTGIRFFSNFINSIVNEISTLSFHSFKTEYSKLSEYEQHNIKKLAAELGLILLSLASSMILFKLANDLDEDSKEREALFYLVYVTRKMYSETSTFLNPIEGVRTLQNPSATLSYINKIGKFSTQLSKDIYNILTQQGFETYDSSYRHGDKKIMKAIGDLTFIGQFTSDIEEKNSYLMNIE